MLFLHENFLSMQPFIARVPRENEENAVPVIVIAHPKGDVGKSTAAINPAGCLARKGPKVTQVYLRDMPRRLLA